MTRVQSFRPNGRYIVQLASITLLFIVISLNVYSANAKVVEFGPKLKDTIERYPERNFLIKFYAPWCHHCQELETTYNNVAERIHNKFDNMIVGRVDCTKHWPICEEYKVKSYPTITFINVRRRVQYTSERTVDDLVAFAERLGAPDFATLEDCKQLKSVTNSRGRILLSATTNRSSLLHTEFKSLASQSSLKATWWFYYLPKEQCKGIFEDGGLYVLKRDLNRAIKFKLEELGRETESHDDLKKSIISWMDRESFPVYGPFTPRNYEKALSTGKLLIIAVLDEYKPAKRFTEPSRSFARSFESFAKKTAQFDDEIIFLWCSEVDLIHSIAIGQVVVPNVMLLKSDYTYSLLLSSPKDLDDVAKSIPAKLHDRSLKMHIVSAKLDELNVGGGNTIPFKILRYIYIALRNFMSILKAEPLLVTILLVCPLGILIFVTVHTCFYEKIYGPLEQEDEENLEDEFGDEGNNRRQNNHIKQD